MTTSTTYLFDVTTSQRQTLRTVATSFDNAANLAMAAFKCPQQSIKTIKLIKVIE